MLTIADDLVLYGGDKSGLAVCTMAGADWKWAAPAITGKTPLVNARILNPPNTLPSHALAASAILCLTGMCL